MMSVTWCLPSRLTVLTMYSPPKRCSWATTPSLRWLNRFSAPVSSRKAAALSSGVAQNLTPSLPALLSGLTTTRVPNSWCHRASSSALVASSCLAPRTPAALIVSIIVNLSRRAALSSVPLVGRPMASLSRSANSTPNSLPAKTATGSYAPAARTVSSRSPVWTMLSA